MQCEDPYHLQRSSADPDQPGQAALTLDQLVRLKFTTPEQKGWWYSKFTAVRRLKLARLSEAQNHRCCYCGCHTWLRKAAAGNHSKYAGRQQGMRKWQMATLEHVVAQTHGGSDSLWNLVMCCAACNSARGSLYSAEEFFAFFQGGTGQEGRRAALDRASASRVQRITRDRQLERDIFAFKLALLFHWCPGLYQHMMRTAQAEKDSYHARREAMNKAQRQLKAA